jgi:acyl-[acyl-carrier-protein] desaturase
MIMASAFYSLLCKPSAPGTSKPPTAAAAAGGGNGIHALAITRSNWYVRA